jgi:hypothetical protein
MNLRLLFCSQGSLINFLLVCLSETCRYTVLLYFCRPFFKWTAESYNSDVLYKYVRFKAFCNILSKQINKVFGAGHYSKPEVTYVTFHKEKNSNIPATMHLRFSPRLQFLDDLVLLGSLLCLYGSGEVVAPLDVSRSLET